MTRNFRHLAQVHFLSSRPVQAFATNSNTRKQRALFAKHTATYSLLPALPSSVNQPVFPSQTDDDQLTASPCFAAEWQPCASTSRIANIGPEAIRAVSGFTLTSLRMPTENMNRTKLSSKFLKDNGKNRNLSQTRNLSHNKTSGYCPFNKLSDIFIDIIRTISSAIIQNIPIIFDKNA